MCRCGPSLACGKLVPPSGPRAGRTYVLAGAPRVSVLGRGPRGRRKARRSGICMLKERFNLSGRTALVTGGSKGIGKAVARGLAEAGANIAISARHEDELKKAKAEISDGTNVKVEYFVADMN